MDKMKTMVLDTKEQHIVQMEAEMFEQTGKF